MNGKNQPGLPKPKSNKLFWEALGIAVLIMVALVVIQAVRVGRAPVAPVSEEPQVIKVDSAVVLEDFPEGFPVESVAQNTDSYKYLPANSQEQQSTVEYISTKSFADNKRIFKDFLSRADFEVVNTDEQSDFAFYYATKDGNDLSIRLLSRDSKVTVSVSYLKR